MAIVTRLHRSVQRLLRHGVFSPSDAVLVRDLVTGISATGSCHLSETARLCGEEDEPLLATERRLSKQLGARNSTLDALPDAWLREAATYARAMPYVSVDLSDIAKPHGRAFEHLARVSDRSAPGKPTIPGYWYVTIEASDDARRHVPLAAALFSTNDPDYAGWWGTIHAAIDQVMRAVGNGPTYLLDRGFDHDKTMEHLDDVGLTWVIRLKRSRDVTTGTGAEAKRWNVAGFAKGLRKPYSVTLPYVQKTKHVVARTGLSFGFAPVRVGGRERTLIAVTGTRGDDWLLLTNKKIRKSNHAAELVRAYVARWGGEEWIRATKQCTAIEDVRVRKWSSLRRMMWLTMIVMGIQALWLLRRSRGVEALLVRVKSFFVTVPFLHYRLFEGVKRALAHGS